MSVNLPINNSLELSTIRANWKRNLGSLVLCSLAILFVFWSDWSTLANMWLGTETYSHGILIAPISVWLIWRERHAISQFAPRTWFWGVVGLPVVLAVWLLGKLSGIQFAVNVAIVSLIPMVVLIICGPRVSWRISFAVLFLYFMVPFGEAAVPLLMKWTAVATIQSLRLTGVPVFQEGMNFVLPSGQWSVVEACSGLRYLVASAVLAVLFSYLNFRSNKYRLAFFTVSMIIALVANWIRAYMVVMVGHLSNMKYGTGDDHVYYGWVFFGVVMFALFWMGAKWREDLTTNPIQARSKLQQPNQVSETGFVQKLIAVVAIICALVGTRLSLDSLHHVLPRTAQISDIGKSLKLTTLEKLSVEPEFKSALGIYRGTDSANSLNFYAAYFAGQAQSSEMISYDNGAVLSDNKNLKVLFDEVIFIDRSNAKPLAIRQILMRSPEGLKEMFFWMRVGDHETISNYKGKLFTVLSILSGKGDHSAAVAIMRNAAQDTPTEISASDKQIILKWNDALATITQ